MERGGDILSNIEVRKGRHGIRRGTLGKLRKTGEEIKTLHILQIGKGIARINSCRIQRTLHGERVAGNLMETMRSKRTSQKGSSSLGERELKGRR